MKILIDARLYGLENAGIGRYVMSLVQEIYKLDQKNDYVIVLNGKYFNELKFGEKWKKVMFSGKHYGFSEQLKLPRLIDAEKPDLVHFPHFNVPIRYKGKYVVTIHDMLMHKQKGVEATTLPRVVYYTKRLGYRKVFSNAIRRSEKVIVPTKYVQNEVCRYYKLQREKVIVTYEGVDKNIWAHAGTEKTVLRKYGLVGKYFVYAGNAYPHKNLARAIEAVTFLNKRLNDENVVLAIATSRGVFQERLVRIVDNLDARKYVKLLGFVPDDELGNIYAQSLGFVFPTLSEGFGLPGLEAMSAGTLALVSEIPVLKEVYRDHAIYFNPHDFSSIERTMKNVMEMDPKKRRKMIIEGKKLVERYSWEKMARETLAVYEEAAK
ncbi:hypothetical protein A2415_05250 [candidate division WWE3 bacterium RIFOXYC1_FULL_39_7]|uniref:Glycosyl transferase family 1 n=1 Tax=candidate division WWE3 bacterium RIFOXYC1_FULL_39_7 TaxID=1802643 RepID=A0A1F4WJH9_UNCKA|nr:MAG: hypothetical protein A2415_05250 [candidate division WWE3 bacterium RIFOXYC1_FULL_39_7]